jgi:hypothetical protein
MRPRAPGEEALYKYPTRFGGYHPFAGSGDVERPLHLTSSELPSQVRGLVSCVLARGAVRRPPAAGLPICDGESHSLRFPNCQHDPRALLRLRCWKQVQNPIIMPENVSDARLSALRRNAKTKAGRPGPSKCASKIAKTPIARKMGFYRACHVEKSWFPGLNGCATAL